MNRPTHAWLVAAVCLCVVFAALAWLTHTVLHLDRTNTEIQQQAVFEERVRLALWRADSLLAPLLATENARPPEQYGPAFAVGTRSPLIKRHFELAANDEQSSSQPEAQHVPAELAGVFDYDDLAALLPPTEPQPSVVQQRVSVDEPPQQQQTFGKAQQRAMNVLEQTARQRAVGNYNELAQYAAPAVGTLHPLWYHDALLLVRRVGQNGDDVLQGCWLDWPAMQRALTNEIADLLPQAHFEPWSPDEGDPRGRVLAALPIRVDPGPLAVALLVPPSPLRPLLVVAWFAVVLAAGAVVALLAGVLALSERRAAFVSAVTHELRTPLTTFRLYADLLADERVEPPQRQGYLKTLATEAVRLQHLVENVLAYARLERRRITAPDQPQTIEQLLGPVLPRLVDRAAQAGLALDVRMTDDARLAEVRAPGTVVDQILFNLVDNACKYATGSGPPRIELSVALADRHVVVRVRDFGPGITAVQQRRLFRPFHKSAQAAAHSAPGVGLGLALSRRLARALGGDLSLAHTTESGACFDLRLPRASA